MKSRVSLKYFVNDCLWKHCFAPKSPQVPSNLIPLKILGTLRFITRFLPKIRAVKLQKSAKICRIW